MLFEFLDLLLFGGLGGFGEFVVGQFGLEGVDFGLELLDFVGLLVHVLEDLEVLSQTILVPFTSFS